MEPICERLVTDTEKLTADSESSAQTELYELHLMIVEVWVVTEKLILQKQPKFTFSQKLEKVGKFSVL